MCTFKTFHFALIRFLVILVSKKKNIPWRPVAKNLKTKKSYTTCIILDEEFLSSAATEQKMMMMLVKLALTRPRDSSTTKLSSFQFFSTTGHPPSREIIWCNGASPTASILPLHKTFYFGCEKNQTYILNWNVYSTYTGCSMQYL